MKHNTADPAQALHKRAVLAIATATGSTSLLMNVWFPFLPLYMLQVGAKDEASALLWVAIGASAQGAGRLIGGPVWGLLSDRLGRKTMFVRAVYFAALTSLRAQHHQRALAGRHRARAAGPAVRIHSRGGGADQRQRARRQSQGRPQRRLRRAVPRQRDRAGGRRGHGGRNRLSRRDFLVRTADRRGGDRGHLPGARGHRAQEGARPDRRRHRTAAVQTDAAIRAGDPALLRAVRAGRVPIHRDADRIEGHRRRARNRSHRPRLHPRRHRQRPGRMDPVDARFSANSACATSSPSPACSPRSRICCSR